MNIMLMKMVAIMKIDGDEYDDDYDVDADV